MTKALKTDEIARRLNADFPGSVVSAEKDFLVIAAEHLVQVAQYLRDTADLELNYLANLTAVDYLDYFEVVYHLVSLENNNSLVLKVRCYDRQKPAVPSVYHVWRTADLQEREVYDLMGIIFEGHPNLKRLFLWEGFEGHPLRRDYL